MTSVTPGTLTGSLLSDSHPAALGQMGEEAWIEVIRKMDEVYADLLRNQVELEEKNRQLEDAQNFIDSVRSAMTDVLLVCDRQGRILQVNAALERLTGKPASEWLHQSVDALFHPDSATPLTTFRELLGQRDLADVEVAFNDAHGHPALLALNGSRRTDRRGRFLGWVLIGRSVGELRRAYAQLQRAHAELQETQRYLVQAEKMASLGRLVAGVAHELNNPISFVYGNMHALKRYAERIAEYLSACGNPTASPELAELRGKLKIDRTLADLGPLIDGTLEGAERVSQIVQDLRSYSGIQQEPLSRCDVPQLIHTALHWVGKASRQKPAVRLDLPESLELRLCKGKLHQILVNLLQNALDVMEGQEPARLEIASTTGQGQLRIDIRDHGPGIPDGALGKVFEPFFTTKPVGKGTGLGLYISYGLALEQGGDLRVANHPDGGAIFSLILPVEDDRHGE